MLARILSIRSQNADQRTRGQLLKGVVLLLGGAVIVSLGNVVVASDVTSVLLAMHLGLIVVLGLTFGLAHLGYVRSGGALLVSVLFLAIAVAVRSTADASAVASPSFVLPILLAGLLINGAAVLVFGALSIAELAFVALSGTGTWDGQTTNHSITILVATGLTWLIIKTLQHTLATARHQTAAALEAQHDLAEQQAATSAKNEELSTANDQMRALLDLVRDLETPVIPLLDGVLVLPLVGHIDTRRATQLTDTVLTAVHHQRARVVIIDITGVSVVDTAIAKRLGQLAQSIQLLGAQVLVTGIRAEVAQTIVAQQIDFANIRTAGRLQDGIATVLNVTALQSSQPKEPVT